MLEAHIHNPSLEMDIRNGHIVPPEEPEAIVMAVEEAFTDELAPFTMLHWTGIVEELIGGQDSPPAQPPEQGGGVVDFEAQRLGAEQAKVATVGRLVKGFVHGDPRLDNLSGDVTILAAGGSCGTERTLSCEDWKVTTAWSRQGNVTTVKFGW